MPLANSLTLDRAEHISSEILSIGPGSFNGEARENSPKIYACGLPLNDEGHAGLRRHTNVRCHEVKPARPLPKATTSRYDAILDFRTTTVVRGSDALS